MKSIIIETKFKVFEDETELPKDAFGLMQKAKSIRLKAYAPYSNFKVGAALLLDNGKIITGNNQENAAYPSGLCAERSAIFYAGSQHPETKILAIAIIAGSINKTTTHPIPPCGACRQAISEYEIKQNAPIEIYFMGETGKVVKSNSIEDLLPFGFDKSFL